MGLALGDRRRTAKLAALGGVGSLLAGIAAVVVAFLFLASSEALYGVRGSRGVFGGAMVGASLGLAFWNRGWTLALALAGAVGSGVGVIVGVFSLGAIFGEAFRAGTSGTIVLYAVTGIFGGASLGATLAYLQWAASRLRGRAMLRLASCAGALLLGGLLFAGFVLPGRDICTDRERAAFSEFPQYGGLQEQPDADSHSGGCAVLYETSAPPEKVAGYLAERLEEHGWEVEHRLEAEGDGSERFGGELVTAYRDGIRYDAGYESLEFYEPPRPGTHVAVHVFEDRRNTNPSCGSEQRAALAEFAHYGGEEVGEELEAFPLPGKAKGACVTGYPAKDTSQEQVSAYYRKKLTEHGWDVEQLSSSTEASRGGLRYVVRYWPNPRSTEVEVQVFTD